MPDAEVHFGDGVFQVRSQTTSKYRAEESLTFEGLIARISFSCGQKPLQNLVEEAWCCVLNEALAVLFQRFVWHARDAGNLWRFVYDESDMGLEDSIAFWEQFAALAGHPTHVMAKSKLDVHRGVPLCPQQVCRYKTTPLNALEF